MEEEPDARQRHGDQRRCPVQVCREPRRGALLGVALVLVGLGLVFFRVWAVKAREQRIEDMAEAIRRSRL